MLAAHKYAGRAQLTGTCLLHHVTIMKMAFEFVIVLCTCGFVRIVSQVDKATHINTLFLDTVRICEASPGESNCMPAGMAPDCLDILLRLSMPAIKF